MVAAAYLLLSLGWLGLYSGFTDTDPRKEISAMFQGAHAVRGSLSKVPLSPKPVEPQDSRVARQTLAQHASSIPLAH